MSMDHERFVNPYSFVGVPANINRQQPPGHDRPRVDALYGSITVRWNIETPLLLPADARKERWLEGRSLSIPGASMKGAIRSLHETLFNGCLRVIDGDYLPAYRDPAKQDDASGDDEWDWRLAVVQSSVRGEPKTLRLCGPTVWVEATSLKRAYDANPKVSGLPATGQMITIVGEEVEAELGRREIRRVERVAGVEQIPVHREDTTDSGSGRDQEPVDRAVISPGRRVLLVTDTAARKWTRANSTARGRAFWATALTNEDDTETPVGRGVYQRFFRTCVGSRDAEVERREQPTADQDAGQERAPVKWWPDLDRPPTDFKNSSRAIARRAKATGDLPAGSVVWARTGTEDGKTVVTDLRLSVIWRHLGRGELKTRLPGWDGKSAPALPCRHAYPPEHPARATNEPEEAEDSSAQPVGLCLSCTIFGSADTVGDERDRGRQDGYAGHVRVGPATARNVTTRTVRLAPMGAPHPGAGAFYLADAELPADRERGDLPSHWGSSLDDGKARQVRGRKFYWHSDPEDQRKSWTAELGRSVVPSRYERRSHHRSMQQSEREQERIVVTEGQLTQTIQVNGLTRLEVATLLSAIDPSRALGLLSSGKGRRFASRLGGGKPFGLGSVTAQIDDAELQTAAERYGPAGRAKVPLAELALRTDDIKLLAEGNQFTRYFGQLIRILDLHGLGDWRHHVSYPPAAPWDDFGSQRFDQSFTFFKDNNGERLAGQDRPYEVLPNLPTDARATFDPSSPVAGRRTRQGQSGSGRRSRPWRGGRR